MPTNKDLYSFFDSLQLSEQSAKDILIESKDEVKFAFFYKEKCSSCSEILFDIHAKYKIGSYIYNNVSFISYKNPSCRLLLNKLEFSYFPALILVLDAVAIAKYPSREIMSILSKI